MKNTVSFKTVLVMLLLFASLPLGIFISLSILDELQKNAAANAPLLDSRQDIITQIGIDLTTNWNKLEGFLAEDRFEEERSYISDFYASLAQETKDTAVKFLERQDEAFVQTVLTVGGSLLAAILFLILYPKVRNTLKRKRDQDPTTKLYNRAYLQEEIKNRIKLYLRVKNPFCILMIDIDNFEKIGATYAQPIIDTVLKRLSYITKGMLRDDDTVFRYDEERFVILTKHANTEEAYNLAERLRAKVEDFDFELEEAVTISIGISEFYEEKNTDKLLADAENAMNQAKSQGRNQTCIYHTKR